MVNAVQEATPPSDDESAPLGPLIFISHDSRDASLAEAFSKLLSSVSAGILKTFLSSDKKGSQGFEYGVEWYPELIKKVESASDVVCLLTERSLKRPWILYEAGVAKGKLGIPVHGLALGVPLSKASIGPFAQFQNCDDDLDSLTKLIVQLVRRLPNADPDGETVRTQVEAFKSKIESIFSLQSPQPDADEVSPGEASTSKLFEEIKVMFQDLPSRLERATIHVPRDRSMTISTLRLDPSLMEEVVMATTEGGHPTGVAVLIIASFFREDYPWFYEMGVEVYRAWVAGEPDRETRALTAFSRAVESLMFGPLSKELRTNRDIPVRDLVSFLRRFVYPSDKSRQPSSTQPAQASDPGSPTNYG